MPECPYKTASWFEFIMNVLVFEYIINSCTNPTMFLSAIWFTSYDFLPFIKMLFQGCKFQTHDYCLAGVLCWGFCFL